MRINYQTQFWSLAGVFCVLLSIIVSEPARAQSDQHLKFPYQAFVLHDDTSVSSGPGQAYYSTERLKQGDVVEVYREDPGGWCAIRPVEGSFSLIPESTLEVIEDGVGRILENGTQAWVGTKLGPVDKPMWQVKLQKGETVEVLGQVSWPNPEGHSTIWYQISPPAGEFRWIQKSNIQLPADVMNANSINTESTLTRSSNGPTQSVRSLNEIIAEAPAIDLNTSMLKEFSLDSTPHRNDVRQAAMQIDQADPRLDSAANLNSINQGWRQATRSIDSKGFVDGSFDRGAGNGIASDGSPSSGARGGFQERDVKPRNSSLGIDETMRIASSDLLDPNLARNLDTIRSQNQFSGSAGSPSLVQSLLPRNISDLELLLTREMIKTDPSEWRLQDLEIAANAIHRTSQIAGERLLVEKYLAKIANCKTIQVGFRAGGGTTVGSGIRQSNFPIGSGVNSDVELGTTYDAHGWLTELVRDGGSSQTEYALQDASGTVTHHVAPAPGMNMRRYLKSHVGVIGQRGYHSKLKLDHVTAHRIVELEKPDSTIRR